MIYIIISYLAKEFLKVENLKRGYDKDLLASDMKQGLGVKLS